MYLDVYSTCYQDLNSTDYQDDALSIIICISNYYEIYILLISRFKFYFSSDVYSCLYTNICHSYNSPLHNGNSLIRTSLSKKSANTNAIAPRRDYTLVQVYKVLGSHHFPNTKMHARSCQPRRSRCKYIQEYRMDSPLHQDRHGP